MYDLCAQAAEIPVWQLFGQQARRWTPVGSWTVAASPAHIAEAVQRYSSMGYTWLKYHLSPFENVIDQIEAAQAVAPPVAPGLPPRPPPPLPVPNSAACGRVGVGVPDPPGLHSPGRPPAPGLRPHPLAARATVGEHDHRQLAAMVLFVGLARTDGAACRRTLSSVASRTQSGARTLSSTER